MTASRSWSRRLPDQPVHLDAYEQAHRPVGRFVREPHPAADRDHRAHARSGRPRFHPDLPAVDARPDSGRQRLERNRAAREGRRARGRDHHQHGNRLARGAGADDRDVGAARRVRVGDEEDEGRGRHSARDHQPDQPSRSGRADPRGRLCGHGVDGAPAARGCRVRGQGRAGPCRRDQYLHRLQPGVPRPRVQEPDRVVPAEPARVPRDGTEIHARRAAEAHRGGRRGRPGRMLDRACAARPSGRFVRQRGRDRRPVQHGEADSGQGRVSRSAELLRPRSS